MKVLIWKFFFFFFYNFLKGAETGDENPNLGDGVWQH